MNTFAELQSREIETARAKHKPINSAHEGYSVILEELDEFWEEVRKKCSLRDKNKMVAELVQIAAMAQCTAEDVCMDRFAEHPRSATRPEGSPVSKPDANAGLAGVPGSVVPSKMPCPKCGHIEIARRYYAVGQDTNPIINPSMHTVSTEWVDRSDRWYQPARKECVVHVCRCCGYLWDTDPLPPNAPASATGREERP